MVHHNFKKGQKVLVILKNKEQIVDKYFGETSKFLQLETISIEWKDIRSSTIYRNKGESY